MSDIELTASRRHLLTTAAIIVGVFAGSLRVFELVWHRDALAEVTRQPGGWAGAVVVALCSAVIHEWLHAFGWHRFGRVPWRSIAFRTTWRGMGFTARPNVAVPAHAFRIGMSVPAVVLGVLPVVAGILTGVGLVVLWGLFFVLECFTDIAVLLAVRRVPRSAWLCERNEKLGCRIVGGGGATLRDAINGEVSAMGRIAIACYKPKPGHAEALTALVAEHVATLRSIGLATDRSPITMAAKDGTVVEVFEWASPEAIHAAHSHPVVLKMWERYSEVCDYVPLATVSEASDLFAEFTPIAAAS